MNYAAILLLAAVSCASQFAHADDVSHYLNFRRSLMRTGDPTKFSPNEMAGFYADYIRKQKSDIVLEEDCMKQAPNQKTPQCQALEKRHTEEVAADKKRIAALVSQGCRSDDQIKWVCPQVVSGEVRTFETVSQPQ